MSKSEKIPEKIPGRTIAFQGASGAYSEMACRGAYPKMTPLACRTFADTFQSVQDGAAALAMIPIENTIAGRVADIHHLLPDSGLHIVAEHFQRVNHHLLGVPGAKISGITHVHSHIHALSQCSNLIRELGLVTVIQADTAGAGAGIPPPRDKTTNAVFLILLRLS